MIKLSAVFTLLFFLLLLPETGRANEGSVSLELKNEPLRAALQKISNQTDLSFVYGDSLIKEISVTCNFKNIQWEEVLQGLLSQNKLSYRITNPGQIVVFKNNQKNRKSLSGYIIDRSTSESLPYANISLSGTNRGVISNQQGYFALLDLPDKDVVVDVQYIGYHTKRFLIDSSLVNQKKVLIELEQNPISGDEVAVEINESELLQVSDEISQLAISPYHFSDLPYIGDKDISRALQLMPGISASNFGSSGLNIRGGLPSQNLILLDGMKLYHINHIFGFFSAFNSDAIKDTRVYKGSFPARYGDRLSGVIEMTAKNGDMNHPRLSASLSQAISGAVLELPLFSRGSMLVSFRRSYSDLILGSLYDRVQRTLYKKKVNTDGLLRDSLSIINTDSKMYFYDVLGKLTILPTNNDIMSLSFYKGLDQLRNSEQVVPDEEWRNTESEWGNLGYSFKWYRQWHENYTSSYLLTYSDYFTRYYMSENIASEYIGRVYEPVDTLYTTASTILNNVEDFTIRLDNQWQFLPGHALEFGASYSQTKIRFGMNNEYLNTELPFSGVQESEDKSSLYSVYLQDSWRLRDDLYISGGIRVNRFGNLKKNDWEPRLSVNYHLNSQTTLKAAWGQYYQYILQYGDGSQTLDGRVSWISADGRELPRASANQVILGAQHETSQFLFNIEGYHKRLNGILDSFNDWQYEDAYQFSQQIENRVTGIDFIAQKKGGRINGWFSYDFSNSINYSNFENKSYPSSQNSPHNINLVTNYNYGNFRFSTAWHYASGRPYSIPEVKEFTNEFTDLTYYYFYPPEDRNTERLPASHQLDISLNYHFKLNFIKGKVGLSVFDVYNQKNVWYRDYTIDQGKLNKVDVRMFGTTPTFFLEVKF